MTGAIQHSSDLDENVTTTQGKQNTILIKNFLEHPCTLKRGCYVAAFKLLTPQQVKEIKPVNPAPLHHLLDTNHDDAIQYVNAILKRSKSEECDETYWFSTPQGFGDEPQLTPIQKCILQKLIVLQKLELIQPLPDKQIILMTDASFQAAGYTVLIEDDPNQNSHQRAKPMLQWHTVPEYLLPCKKMSIYAKKFLHFV